MDTRRPSDVAAEAWARHAKERTARGEPPLEGRDLVSAIAALMRETPGAYRVAEGQALTAIDARFRDAGEVYVRLEDGALEAQDRSALGNVIEEITRAFLLGAAHDAPLPSPEQVLWVIAHAWSRRGASSFELTPILEPQAEDEAPGRSPLPSRRRFRHEDGTVWAVAPDGTALHLTISLPGDPDPVERTRAFDDAEECRTALRELVESQLADGFEEDWSTAAFGMTRAGTERGECTDRFFADHDRGLFVVADAFGDVQAADRVIMCLRRAAETATGDGAGVLRKAIEEADRQIAAAPAVRGMGASVVALLLRRPTAHLAWVQHSRAYAIRDDGLALLTPDDWSAGPTEWGFDLASASGDGLRLPEPWPLVGSGQVRVEERRIDVDRGGMWLLCSDGLHRLHPPDELHAVLAHGCSVPLADDEACLARMAARLTWFSAADDDRTVLLVAAKTFAPSRKFPKRLLSGVAWVFSIPTGDAPAATIDGPAEVERELRELSPEHLSTMRSVVLEEPEVDVLVEIWSPADEERITTRLRLRAKDDTRFTGLELLERLHDAIASAQSAGRTLGDRRFLEGLELTRPGPDGVPTYGAILGS